MKKLVSFLLVLLSIAWSAQAADLPYKTYVYDAYKNERAIPMFYEPAACETLALKKAADLCCSDGLIYVLDAGSDRILVLDRDMTPVRKLENLGTKSASGLYVDAQGNIALADTGNQRALVVDAQGNVLLTLTAPDSPLYDQQTAFAPDKVLLDSAGNVYVSVAGLYKGAVVFNAQGEFKGYYGGNKVETTAEVLTDWWWKNILTDEQRNRLNRSLPVAFTNFDMDARDFVYTCSSNIATTSAKVRKLNTSGISLWEQITDREITFGDPDTSIGGVTTSTLFKDNVVLDNGFVVLLDQSSHIFCYDDYANMLFGFHAGGAQEGLFLNPVAIDAIGSDLYVLDQRSGEITRLVLTRFGQLVFSALELYNDGRYLEAGSTWQQVLDMAGQYELAHVGMGMALKKSGEHRAAMTEFRLGNDRVNYSSAYQSVRIAFIRQYGVLIALGLAALVLVWKLTRRWIAPGAGKALSPVGTHLRMMLHPFGGMNELSISRKYSLLFAGAMIVGLIVLDALKFELTGFAFSAHPDHQPYNIFRGAVSAVGLIFLWTITNWGVTTLTDGTGSLKAVLVSTLYAMLPVLVTGVINVVLSNVLTLEEQAFIGWIEWAGYLWAAMMLISAQMNIHEFSLGKALRCIALTLLGMVVVLLLLFMMLVLVRKVYGIFETIYRELTIRA
ncbi:MAG: YIP1 family protein [Aristaeellaceae bacterium]